MNAVVLRKATVRDVDVVRACIADAYAEAQLEISDLPDVTGGIREDIEVRDVTVATQDGEILGVVVFGETLEALMVFNLAVSPQTRGQGVARLLMEAAENTAHEVGLSTLRLRTHRLMTNARNMYSHLGWEECDISDNTVLMEKRV